MNISEATELHEVGHFISFLNHPKTIRSSVDSILKCVLHFWCSVTSGVLNVRSVGGGGRRSAMLSLPNTNQQNKRKDKCKLGMLLMASDWLVWGCLAFPANQKPIVHLN